MGGAATQFSPPTDELGILSRAEGTITVGGAGTGLFDPIELQEAKRFPAKS